MLTLLLSSEVGLGAQPSDWLVDATREAGLELLHVNGMRGKLDFVEMIGPGVAVFDFDDDGDLDVFLPQGHPLGVPQTAAWPRDVLLRNDLLGDERRPGRLRFTDISAASGIERESIGYGVGAAVGDYDNDGRPDLYVTNWGANRLYHNEGGGRFRDVTDEAGVGDTGWGTSATYFDLDRDSWLDLFVANYVQFDLERAPTCYAPSTAVDYCGPLAFSPAPDRLWRGSATGRFEATPLERPGQESGGTGLGVVAADFDANGWLDLFVANDQRENDLWLQREGGLSNEAVAAGAAVSTEGKVQACMGIAIADHDADGDQDLLVTNLKGETNTLYVNDGRGNFEDATVASGLGAPSWPWTGFGVGWFDLDADNDLDVFVANGGVTRDPVQLTAGSPLPLAQRNQLYRNLGGGKYDDVTSSAGAALAEPGGGRGVAFGDIDNDGDTDLLVANNNGPVRLLLNRSPRTHPRWLGLSLRTREGKRDALGARAEIRFKTGARLWRWVHADGSYASASDPRVLVAVPEGDAVTLVRVTWLGGQQEDFVDLVANRYQTLVQGTGRP